MAARGRCYINGNWFKNTEILVIKQSSACMCCFKVVVCVVQNHWFEGTVNAPSYVVNVCDSFKYFVFSVWSSYTTILQLVTRAFPAAIGLDHHCGMKINPWYWPRSCQFCIGYGSQHFLHMKQNRDNIWGVYRYCWCISQVGKGSCQ